MLQRAATAVFLLAGVATFVAVGLTITAASPIPHFPTPEPTTIPATPVPFPTHTPNACDRMVDDFTSFRATSDATDYALHSIGCARDDGGVYVPADYDENSCMRYAYYLWITGRDLPTISAAVTESGSHCVQYEDGTYGLEFTP